MKKKELEKLKTKYSYIDFSDEEITEIIDNVKFSKDMSSAEKEMVVLKKALGLINQKLKENDISIINNGVSLKLSNEKLPKKQVKTLMEFSKFYQNLGIDFDIDIASLLVKDNIYLQKCLDKIVSSKQTIDDSNINLLNLVDAYCMLNNIELDEVNNNTFNDKDIVFSNTLRDYYPNLPNEVLTREEERNLLIEYKNGSTDEYNTLVERNLKLVISIASKYQNRGVPAIDLVQEGCIGLMTAIDKFDVDRGTKLSSYATPWIRLKVTRAIYNQGSIIRIPIPTHEKMSKYAAAKNNLQEKLNRKPTVEEIAKNLRWSPKTVKTISEVPSNVDSIDKKIGEDEDSNCLDYLLQDEEVNVERAAISTVLQEEVSLLLDKVGLTKMQRHVLIRRYGLNGETPTILEEIGKESGTTRQSAGNSELGALRTLRNYIGIKQFAEYMDNPEKSIENIDLFRTEYREKLNKESAARARKKVKTLKNSV